MPTQIPLSLVWFFITTLAIVLLAGDQVGRWRMKRRARHEAAPGAAPMARPEYLLPPPGAPAAHLVVAAGAATLPALLLLAVGRPILAVPLLGLPLAAVWLVNGWATARWQARLIEQSVSLTEQLALRVKSGRTLFGGLQDLARPGGSLTDPIAREVATGLVARVEAGESLADIARAMRRSPRYEGVYAFQDFLAHLASCQSGETSLVTIQAHLEHVAASMKRNRERNHLREAKLAQIKYTVWIVSLIVPVAAIMVLWRAPDLGSHLLYHPAGNLTLIGAALLVAFANWLRARIATSRPLRY